MHFLLVAIVAYLLGSIPFGFLIVRLLQGDDIRQTGSGGTGATNVSRRAGKWAGGLTLVLDAAKGAGAVLLAGLFATGPMDWLLTTAAVAVLIGHIFPIWLGFRGGKGVATAIGVFLVLAPLAVLIAGVVFVAVVAITRYVSLGSIVGAVVIALVIGLERFAQPQAIFVSSLTAAICCAALIILAHRQNISRLIQGTENKFK
ncbi:MAG TPA: glycerol-3-phosphate 1-O-acyltransferase PlsY [Pyrinomonadaceae bacterium]|nr:glycerol-3-phosphate 1-O-acyltransferase PlsY [Pyrinomonadaceae bacterium]